MLDALFSPENKFWMFVAKVADMFFLQCLWLICCIPIVTAGASTAALWKCLNLLARDQEGKPFSDFCKAFKKSFRTATKVWLTQLIAIVFLAADAFACLSMTKAGQFPQVMMFLLGVVTVLAVAVVIISFWLYPLAGVYTHFGWRKVLSNSVYLTLRHLPHTLSCTLLLISSFVVCYYFPKALVLLPILVCYLCAKVTVWIFSHYPNPSDETQNQNPET